jgi:hypothetical protein
MDTTAVIFIIASGIAVVALSYGLDRIWAAALPFRAIYLALRAPGVVLHECSHILGCFLTGARIRKVVLFSAEGGSVTYSRPALPVIGDVVISTAPLFLIPLALFAITWFFSAYLGCTFPGFPQDAGSAAALADLGYAIRSAFSVNLLARFNGWFLLYILLAVSLVLSIAPSTQDWKNAAAGSILLILAGILVAWSGFPPAVAILDGLVRLIGYGFMLGLAYALLALAGSLPLVAWHLYRRCR